MKSVGRRLVMDGKRNWIPKMLVISCVVISLGYGQSQPPTPSGGNGDQGAQGERQPKQAPANVSPQFSGGPSGQPATQAGENKANGNASEWWMIWLTGGLLFVAAFQLYYFSKQLGKMDDTLKATEKSVQAMQTSDERQLRAYVSMELWWNKIVFSDVEDFRFSFFLTNHGRTPAKEIGYRAIADCIPTPTSNLPELPVIEGPWNQKRMTLFPETAVQKVHEMNCNMRRRFTREEISGVREARDMAVRIGIEVKYLDVFEAEHVTQEFFLYTAGAVTIIPGGSRIT